MRKVRYIIPASLKTVRKFPPRDRVPRASRASLSAVLTLTVVSALISMARAKKATTPGPVQSSTIRDFFSGRASLDKHPKKTPPVVKRPKSEVIVIESSDDESTEVKPPPPRKRRKLSTSSDDIEIVDYRRIDISEPGTSRGAVRGTSLALSQTKLSTSTTSLPALSNLNMFGKPNHLLGGLSPPTNASSDGSLGTVCSTNLPSEANSHFVDIDLSNEPEDEWATGDDELAHLILEDGDPTLQVADDFPEEIDAFESVSISIIRCARQSLRIPPHSRTMYRFLAPHHSGLAMERPRRRAMPSQF